MFNGGSTPARSGRRPDIGGDQFVQMALRDYVLADESHTHPANTFNSGYYAQPGAVNEWTEQAAADYGRGGFFGAREQHFHQPGPSHFWNDLETPRPAYTNQRNDFQGPRQSAGGIMPSEEVGRADLAPSFAAPFPPEGAHYTPDLHATDHQRSSNSDSCFSLTVHVKRKGAVFGDGSDCDKPATHLRRRPAQSKEVKKAKKARAAQKYRKDKSERMDFLETQNRKLMERMKQLEQQICGSRGAENKHGAPCPAVLPGHSV